LGVHAGVDFQPTAGTSARLVLPAYQRAERPAETGTRLQKILLHAPHGETVGTGRKTLPADQSLPLL